jgi:hypothetical protein
VEILKVMASHFDDTAFGSEIAFEDDEAARGLYRVVFGADDLLSRGFFGVGGFLGERASGNREAVSAEEAGFKHALCDERSAACCVKISRDISSPRFEIGENWRG